MGWGGGGGGLVLHNTLTIILQVLNNTHLGNGKSDVFHQMPAPQPVQPPPIPPPSQYMGITRSILPQNIGNLSLPFFGGNHPIVLLGNIY